MKLREVGAREREGQPLDTLLFIKLSQRSVFKVLEEMGTALFL